MNKQTGDMHRDNASTVRNSDCSPRITIPGEFSIAAVGDLIQFQPFCRYAGPATQSLLAVLRGADVTVANLEVIIVDQYNYRGPEGDIKASKGVADDIAEMGINFVTKANNHAFDLGEEGFWECLQQVERVGIAHCGAGRSIAEARLPRYFQSQKGLVGMTGTYTCAPRRVGEPISPAVNTLQLDVAVTVTPEQFASLDSILDSWSERALEMPHSIEGGSKADDFLTLHKTRFKKAGTTGDLVYDLNERDKAQILNSIKTGKQFSDFFVAAFHWHENRHAFQKYTFDHFPNDYQIELAHAAIDAGADMVVGHGVHTIKGIEIYKGRPICYGLSNFVFQQQIAPYSWTNEGETRPWGDLNAERFAWLNSSANLEALLVKADHSDGKLRSLKIYPVDLGPGRPGSRLGIPELAQGEVANRILQSVQAYSAPWNTEISIADGIGEICLA